MKEKFLNWLPKVKAGLKWFFFSFIWLGILMLAIDIVSKQIVLANREWLYTNPITYGDGKLTHGNDLIHGFLAISYVVNENVAFGIGIQNNPTLTRIMYIIIATIIIGVIIVTYVIKYKKLTKFIKATLMLVIVGALGNLIDRIFYTPEMLKCAGYNPNNGVVDWINFYGIWPYNFNWADSCIVVGVIMLIVWLIVSEVKEYKANKKLEAKTETGKVLSKDEQARQNENTIEPVDEKKDE